MTRSLKRQNHRLANPSYQIKYLSNYQKLGINSFKEKLRSIDLYPIRPIGVEILQINVGKMCNQICKHCHVDAGPDRKEIMTKETMQYCLDALENTDIHTVDLTGGAPEMNPYFRWFVERLFKMNKKIIVRCNLTIILANSKYNDLPEFFKKHKIEIISSLPHFSASRTDSQRGKGVFEKSIQALKMLNNIGYGKENSDFILNLAYNPTGSFLPSDQKSLEDEFKQKLQNNYNISFNNLFTITNLPISRFLEYLIATDNYQTYMVRLANAFNPAAAKGVMCRNIISVGWDGALYDCDFNQMLDLKIENNKPQHIRDFDIKKINSRSIIVNQHCYGCTAGAGSSCSGATV